MSDGNDQDTAKGRLSLRPASRAEVGRTVDAGSVRQSFSHGRSKVVQVEVRKNRTPVPGAARPVTVAPAPAAPIVAPSPAPAAVVAPTVAVVPQAPVAEVAPIVAAPVAVAAPAPSVAPRHQNTSPSGQRPQGGNTRPGAPGGRALTAAELAIRQRVLAEQTRENARREVERREQEKISILSAAEEARKREEAAVKAAEEEVRRAAEEAERAAIAEEARRNAPPEAPAPVETRPAAPSNQTIAPPPRAASAQAPAQQRPVAAVATAAPAQAARPGAPRPAGTAAAETLRLRPAAEDDDGRRRPGMPGLPARKAAPAPAKKAGDQGRRPGRIDVQAAIEGEDDRVRSLASVRRQRERERRQADLDRLRADQVKVVREVVLPDAITVQELANRMAARASDVIKALMKMGVMSTITQSLDADTAELVVQEFGHKVKRVSEDDVEVGLEGLVDIDTDLETRPPVVTIMGHVDHGKTSLLDALRRADVAAGEAGGITQHIGAYQVTMPEGEKITFIDTPGHEAFTAMRSRGASVTDIVILVVAADDGVMPQTIEAIKHAKAADVPIIVAINKIDKPDANLQKVREELLSYEIVVEDLGGDTMDVAVSAKNKLGLDKLAEAILLQAEVLDLKANPRRAAEGTVIESRLDRGRGPVATVLVQKGTLRQGDIVVAGAEFGRVRAMLDDKGRQMKEAGPSTPLEILGLAGVPSAGEPFVVVENESRAREISELRQRRIRDKNAGVMTAARGTLDEMLARIQAGVQKEVAVLIKADVQGSSEALQATVLKLAHEEVRVRVLNSTVGQITESDIQLAKASQAVIIAFNVRATTQARDMATRDGVDIRYYSIIYDVADDVEQLVRGKVAPKAREKFLGYAEIRMVFDITKTGKVAGCMVTEGLVKRGCGVRLLREGVVIHNGELTQLKRFKDDVKEVARGYECGLSFANYQDLRVGDVVECFDIEMVPG
jgi:translation initiation factor IF-2